MDKKLKTALKQSFTPPPTQRKTQFTNSISCPKARFREVVISQILFIRKRVWLLFMISTCFAFFYTEFANIPENIVAVVSAILPFISLCTAMEIYKSAACNMEEMELACKYNLTKIMLMRLGVLGTVSFIMLALFVLIVGKSDFGMFRNIVYITVPYLLSSYLSLSIISKLRSKETIYVCAGTSGVISVLILLAGSSYKFIYHLDFMATWVALFTILVGLLSYSLIRFTKSQEELQWNLL